MIHRTRQVMQRVLLLVTLSTFLGCSQKALYSWGSYEGSLYSMYSTSESYNIDRDISVLTTEVQRTVQRNQQVPPGKYAHLGYLHYVKGNKESARTFLLEEKKAFPESGVFIDGLLARMK